MTTAVKHLPVICWPQEQSKVGEKESSMSQFMQDRVFWLCWGLTSTIVGHFLSSPREREKRHRRDSRGDEREGQGWKRNRNGSEDTEEIKNSPNTFTCYKDTKPCPTVSQYQLDTLVTTPLPHPTTPWPWRIEKSHPRVGIPTRDLASLVLGWNSYPEDEISLFCMDTHDGFLYSQVDLLILRSSKYPLSSAYLTCWTLYLEYHLISMANMFNFYWHYYICIIGLHLFGGTNPLKINHFMTKICLFLMHKIVSNILFCSNPVLIEFIFSLISMWHNFLKLCIASIITGR